MSIARRITLALVIVIGWEIGQRFSSPFGIDAWILGLIGVAASVVTLAIAEVAVAWIAYWLQP